MKKLRLYFTVLTSAFPFLFFISCDKDECEECDSHEYIENVTEQGPFVEYLEAKSFYDAYTYYSMPKALIDTREKSKFDAEHLPGAVNLPADIDNTANNNAQWSQDLLALYPKNTCLFFYGTTSFQMTKAVAGRASRLGYGKENSRIFSKGYDELKPVWK